MLNLFKEISKVIYYFKKWITTFGKKNYKMVKKVGTIN